METFKIKSSSWVLYILTLLVVVIGSVPLVIKLFHTRENPTLGWILAVVVVIVAYYATTLTSLAIIEVSLSEHQIHMKWIKNFLFQSYSERTINWNEIVDYKFQKDKNFDLLKLTLDNGEKIRFWHNNGFTKDDFYKLVSAFEVKVIDYDERDDTSSSTIKRDKTFYETRAGLVTAVLLALLLVALPIVVYLLPHSEKVNWISVAIIYSSGLFYIGQVLRYRRKTM